MKTNDTFMVENRRDYCCCFGGYRHCAAGFADHTIECEHGDQPVYNRQACYTCFMHRSLELSQVYG